MFQCFGHMWYSVSKGKKRVPVFSVDRTFIEVQKCFPCFIFLASGKFLQTLFKMGCKVYLMLPTQFLLWLVVRIPRLSGESAVWNFFCESATDCTLTCQFQCVFLQPPLSDSKVPGLEDCQAAGCDIGAASFFAAGRGVAARCGVGVASARWGRGPRCTDRDSAGEGSSRAVVGAFLGRDHASCGAVQVFRRHEFGLSKASIIRDRHLILARAHPLSAPIARPACGSSAPAVPCSVGCVCCMQGWESVACLHAEFRWFWWPLAVQGRARGQVSVQSSGRRPGPGNRWSGGGAMTLSFHPDVLDSQLVLPGRGIGYQAINGLYEGVWYR